MKKVFFVLLVCFVSLFVLSNCCKASTVPDYKLSDISGDYKYTVIRNSKGEDLLEVFNTNNLDKVLWVQKYDNVISVDFLDNNVLAVANFLSLDNSQKVQIQLLSLQNGSVLYNNMVNTVTSARPANIDEVVHVSYKEQAQGIIVVVSSLTTQSTLYIDKNSYKDIIQPIYSKPWNSNPDSVICLVAVVVLCIMTGSLAFVSFLKSREQDSEKMRVASTVYLCCWVLFVIFTVLGFSTQNFYVYNIVRLLGIPMICVLIPLSGYLCEIY